MVGRGELTERAWTTLEPLLPARGRRGGQWRDHRTVSNGILWKLRTGAPWRHLAPGRDLARPGATWRDLPERDGAWQTCADRLDRWRREGLWDRLLTQVQTKAEAVGEVVWEVSSDRSTARAHQHASGARRRRSRAEEQKGSSTPPTRDSGEGLGRGTRAQP